MTPARMTEHSPSACPVSIALGRATLEGNLGLPAHPCANKTIPHG